MSKKSGIYKSLNIDQMRQSPFYNVFTQNDETFKELLEGYEKHDMTVQDLAYACFYVGIEFCMSYSNHVYTEMRNTALNISAPQPESGSTEGLTSEEMEALRNIRPSDAERHND
jgi:hypothetical protein